ncbi:MAG TPA: glycosyltransferase [Thermoleophilaceae bacterium]|nr:glycosyltransferase [Thermoleophilaceae bacterium]
MSTPVQQRTKVMRVIARLNMGGPAHHVGFLSGLLDPARYETILFHGEVGAGEAALSSTADRYGVRREVVPGLRPELRPLDDLRALVALVRAVRRFRPDIVHTHTAKAGMLGRLAALATRPRPIIIHTYHGHVLEGYFGRLLNAFYRTLERGLARVSNVLIGVSSATVDDLVRLRIAPRAKFRVVPVGLDLEPFLTLTLEDGQEFRREAGADDHVLLTFVGRLVPIKRVDVLLRAVARASDPRLRLAIVGDGELRDELEALADELGIREQVWFAGYRAEMLPVAAASDIAVLSSDNEGTPVSLIEAGAAATVAASTRVGGVADVVTPETGVVVPAGDSDALGEAIAALAADASRREQMGARARAHVRERYSVDRLVRDIDKLYSELLSARAR